MKWGFGTWLAWGVLGVLLAATLVGAATLDRREWPGFVGDEAVYLMQAESLAWDLDLTYTRADYERFVGHWGRPPDGLILQSGDGGATLTFGKPPFYSLAIAPLVRLAPVRGAPVANALLLALAAVAAALALRSRLGGAAPHWVAVFVFASVTFAYVFWAHADLFLMVLTALALALAFGGAAAGRGGQAAMPESYADETTEPARRFAARWATAGALLAVVALSRPFYAGLLVAAALAVPARRRRAGLAALAAGAAALALAAVAASLAVHGSWTPYGGERVGFYAAATGFPEVDFPAAEWPQRVAERGGPGSWIAPGRLLPYDFEPRLWAWDLLYLLAGRHVGLLPYFLPVVLGIAAFRATRARWALLLAVAAALAGFLTVRPFNFYGGGAALANRYFLPLYPAFWFLAARPVGRLLPLAVAALAAPLLWPLWSAPRAYPYGPSGGYRTVSALAERWLPYETTQSHLKPAGVDDFTHHGLWVKLLRPELRPAAGGAWITLEPGAAAELLIGRQRRLEEVHLEFASDGPTRVEISGAGVGDRFFHPDGRTGFQLLFAKPSARHPMWWTSEPFNLYRLHLQLPAASPAAGRQQRFRLLPQE